MDYNRGGKRGRSPNRRFIGRGYRRGNIRGNYYPWRPNWHFYNNHYAYPYPEKPPSPLPGTEEYRQRNIQQTSDLIKKQLNIDSNTCNNANVNPQGESNVPEHETQNKIEAPQLCTTSEQKKAKSKKNQTEKEEEIDVQKIYDKIVKHISNLSHSKKLNLINQTSSGYDIAIQQIQKQKQLELSKALRDMSQRPKQDTDEVIQSIIPDIGIKLEDLPDNVIEELSKTLQVKFEYHTLEAGTSDFQTVDMNISPISELGREERKPAREGVIDNIFDFEYLNKTESYEDTLDVSKDLPIPEEEESEFSMANIDVTKSYLPLIELPSISKINAIEDKISECESIQRSDCKMIRIKTDIFNSPEKEKQLSNLAIKEHVENKDTIIVAPKEHQSSSMQNNSSTSTHVKDSPVNIQNTYIEKSNPLLEEASTSLSLETSSYSDNISSENIQNISVINSTASVLKPNTSVFGSENENSNNPTSLQQDSYYSPGSPTSDTTEPIGSIFADTNENSSSAEQNKSPAILSEQQNADALPILTEATTSNVNTNNENLTSTINSEQNQNYPSAIKQESPDVSEPPMFTNSSPKSPDSLSFVSESTTSNVIIANENPSDNTSIAKHRHSSPFEWQSVHAHISPLLRDVQTPPHHLTTDTSTRKKWKSPGEKKMIPSESEYRPELATHVFEQASTVNENLSPKLIEEQEVTRTTGQEKAAVVPPGEAWITETEKADVIQSDVERKTSNSSKGKSRRHQRRKRERKPDIVLESMRSDIVSESNSSQSSVAIAEKPQSKISEFDLKPTKTCREVGIMANFDSRHKRRRKIDVQIQTENINEPAVKQREFREMATMTNERKLITVSAQTPIRFFKKNFPAKATQTMTISCKNVEIQASERMKNDSTQTIASEDTNEKYTALLNHLKLMEDIDEQIKDLLVKKNVLCESIGLLNRKTKNNANKRKRVKKNKDPTSDTINHEQIEPKCSENNETNQSNVKEIDNVDVNEKVSLEAKDDSNIEDISPNLKEADTSKASKDTPLEIEQKRDYPDKNQPIKKFLKEGNDSSKKSQPNKDKSSKQLTREINLKAEHPSKITSPKYAVSETKETENKPLKISLKVEKDANNIKKYSLKRERSRSSSKDSEPKMKRPTLQSPSRKDDEGTNAFQHREKRFKVSKEIETLVYNDTKFMKNCCVKIKPIKSVEGIREAGENVFEKSCECPEESSRSPRDQVEKEPNLPGFGSENVASPHSTCSTSSTSSGKQKSKVIDKLEFKGLTGSIYSLKAIDDELLAASDDGVLYFFNVITQDLTTSIKLSAQALTCLHVVKTDDECLIHICGLDGNLRIVDYAKKEIEKTVDIEHKIQCMDLSWGYAFLGSTTGDLDIFNVKAGKLEDSIRIFNNSRIYAIKAMQEGARRVLLMGTKDTELSIRDAMTGLLMRTVGTGYCPTIYSILSDQNLVYCGTNQHDVLVYSFHDGGLVKKYEGIASRRVVCMQIVDNLLFVGCFNGSVCVFHKNTHQYLGHMIRPGESLLSMLIVNNKVIVGLKNSKLVSWDVPVVYLEKNR